jgi:hypothetical protein
MENTIKKFVAIAYLLIGSGTLVAQIQNQDENTVYYQLNSGVDFYEVNSRYQIMTDTIFHSEKGFKIYPDIQITTIGKDQYYVITYPSYKNGTQSSKETAKIKEQVEEEAALPPVHCNLSDSRYNDKILVVLKSTLDTVKRDTLYSISFKNTHNYKFAFGQLTLPFKLRPKNNDKSFQMSTDVTVGAYGGIRKRISRSSNIYLTIPFVGGLSFININDNTTNVTAPTTSQANIVPGITICSGMIIQISTFNMGFVGGGDFASSVAGNWIYHGNFWYSFALGYSFLK